MNKSAPPHEKANRLRLGWRRRILNRYTLILAIVILGLGGYFAWQKFYLRGDGADQYQIAIVQRGDIEDLVTATGTMQPREYVDVGAQVSGQMKKIHVEVGSVVEAGDLLAEIDPTVYLATVDARRAQLRNQRATLTDRESQLALARLHFARQKNLMVGDATTTESLQSAEAAVRSAKAQMDALQALIEQTESTLRADEASLNYAKIYAPMSGVVVSITARQGQTLNASQQAPIILRIADLSTMTVQTQVSEADVSQLRPNMDVYFTTLGSRGKRWYGNLRKVEPTPAVNNNVVLYNALFDVTNAQRNLLPQMTAQVFFISAMAKDALIVPAAAVNIRRGGEARERADAGNSSEATTRDAERRPRHDMAASVDGARTESGKKNAGADPRATVAERPMLGSAGNFRELTPDQRRAAFARMIPEERESMKARRRAAGDRGREQDQSAATASEGSASARSASAAIKRSDPKLPPRTAAVANQPAAPVWAGVVAQRQRGPREASVKVLSAEGKVEERKVQVGISNRVHVQILSGLNEGERVIAGVKPQPGAPRTQGQRNALQTGVPGGQGMGGRGR